jgi:serine/threonine-protein kinase
VDARADIYALGAVAYDLLTAQTPFRGANVVEIYHGHLLVAPTAPSQRLGRPVPAELEGIVMECLAKSPADRPASASVVADRLEALRNAYPWSESEARAWWHARPTTVTREPRAVIGDPGLTSGLGPTEAPPVKLTVRQRPR